jgi:hypothetical protein
MTIHEVPVPTRRDDAEPAVRSDVRDLRKLVDDGSRLELVDNMTEHTRPPVLRPPAGRPSPDAA